ncbi:thioredoxin-related transmembrane protein 1-like [Styela clava]
MRSPIVSTLLSILFCVNSVVSGRSKVISITAENWRETLEGEWMLKFYAPWCPACRSMEEDYKQFADWSDDLNIKVGEININEEAGLSGRFIVTALPSIYHAKDGEYRRYVSSRDANSLHRYIEDKIWRGTEPVAWYRHPDSIPMTLMSGLFRTSVIMKNFHETLTETYGFSTTASYVIFALATIATGLLLGLIMVFIIDCVSPPRPRAPPVTPRTKDEIGAGDVADKESADEGGKSTGRESLSGSEREDSQRAEKDRKSDASEGEEEGKHSRASSQSSSRTSQEWEQVHGAEAEDAENELSVERNISADKEEGQGEVRKRNVKSDETKEE